MRAASEPGAQSSDERDLAGVVTDGVREIGCFAELPIPMHSDIGRKLTADLVAQSKCDLQRRQPRADAIFRIVFAIELELQLRLQDETLSDERIVLALETRSGASLFTDVQCGIHV